MFSEGKFKLLALRETKLKGNGVNGITIGVQEMEKAKEGVSILLNNVWHRALWVC